VGSDIAGLDEAGRIVFWGGGVGKLQIGWRFGLFVVLEQVTQALTG